MKNLKNILSIILLFISYSNTSFSQVWEEQTISSKGTIDFINPNIGWSVVSGSQGYNILRTMNKGISWDSIYGFSSSSTSENIAIDLVNINLGFIYFGGEVIKTSNGGQNWITVYNFNTDNDPSLNSIRPLIKFVNSDTGYISYTRFDLIDAIKIFRTTNSGTTWDEKMHYPPAPNRYYKFYDLTFENNNPSIVTFCGYAGFTTNSDIRYFGARSTNGGETFVAFDGPIASNTYKLKYISNLPGQTQNCRMLMVEYRSNSDRGTYCYDFINGNLGSKFKINDNSDIDKVGGFKFIDQNFGYVYIGNELYKTTNSGVNWNVEYTTPPFTGTNRNSHFIEAFGDQIFLGTYSGSIYTKKLTTNFQTYFDNQSSPSSIIFDGTQYASPGTQYLRGGYSSLSANGILNPGQSNERIFYKWSDGYFYSNHAAGYSNGFDFYFDMSGTTIANYYKTKQLSEISSAIGKPAQTKSIRDVTVNNVTATHTLHESMGGIFYSKSTDFGLTYQTEETVNLNDSSGTADGNKNASLSVIGNSGSTVPITFYDGNRNVAVVWEKYNPTTGNIEIKLARRILNTQQTGYEWKTYKDNNGNQYVTSFTAAPGFESKPNCFVTSNQIALQHLDSSLIIITYIRPSGSQNKLFASVRYNSQSMDYELDNGDITDLSTVSPFNNYRIYEINFTYKKSNNIVYRKENIGIDPSIGMYHYLVELNNNISIGDGYSARYKPDISLMDGLPVVSYAANYNSNAWVSYEGGETDIINLQRYPINKKKKKLTGDWGDYIIYNSTSLQDNPDIEGSSTTQSYLINYSLGNGQFKKVVKVQNNPGYFCEPNTFTGTDSKLIKNSYTGSFGNNLSLLTLSPEASVYKLSKQNFAITNIITAADQYDNFGGVVNLDTVRYSFNLGPIMIKEPNEEVGEVPFGQYYIPSIPVVTSVEFNQNLR
ncbi:MAG: hypothetical protein KDD00_13045 [Ignavibacteriae bacterium]|nr:hypothetical protein [Ignavibacteriota bacterium]